MTRIKILVIENEAIIRAGITLVLQSFTVKFPFMEKGFDYTIIEAANGENGIEIIKKGGVDILLLNNKLPGIKGLEVLEYINTHRLNISVTMITSDACLDLAIAATNNGADGFIAKPFTPQELRISVENSTKQLYLKRMTRQMTTQCKSIRYKFLSVLSHELKSPLNAIEGYLQLMDDKELGNNMNDYHNMIGRSMQRISGMRSLIMDLLDLTQLENTQGEIVFRTIDLSEICKMSIELIRPIAIQKNLRINIDISSGIMFMANVRDMEIMFNNVLSNAVKYNKMNGLININMRESGAEIIISITDTGIGIDENDIDKLFLEFSRLKNKETRDISGSGLGLSILKQIVESYDGKVEVKSELGKGSTFIINLPNKPKI
ncbi:MAG: hypothetical protein DRI84_08955 [Bacteroidetes bacterium]|nr:MAG: hypothetical protein DRI86_11955 [Bacteroidota bacterium]RLD64111.1 MAG: hypothetical protein DRI84_08955 [Bacteroidota bacterium]